MTAKRELRHNLRWLRCVWVCVLLAPTRLLGVPECPSPRVITRDELIVAMRQHGNYDIVPTPNWGRFQTDVFLNLMHTALARDPQGGVILIPAEDWYQAYVEVARLAPDAIHQGTRLAREVGQMTLLDFRRNGVIRRWQGAQPVKLAANARVYWPDSVRRSKISYRDTLTDPKLQVTFHREITYRLLELDSMVFYDDMRGVYGRPTSGVLGFLFSVFGEGALVESRLAFARDDFLVVRARSKKILSKTVTVVVPPGGRGDNGVPPGRTDLSDLEQLLRQPIEVEYLPYRC